jgi:DNA invertase Pin-like site-specific DNA recombinase
VSERDFCARLTVPRPVARAKANGINIGRPKLGIEIRQKIAQRARKGETPYAIAKALGIDRHTAAKYTQLRT